MNNEDMQLVRDKMQLINVVTEYITIYNNLGNSNTLTFPQFLYETLKNNYIYNQSSYNSAQFLYEYKLMISLFTDKENENEIRQ